jgi:hypothetical protein
MECERSDPGDPLRQGDIIAAQPRTDGWKNPWTRFAVIISADCDLAQGKTGPNLVLLPIISHHTYLADMWLPAESERLAQRGRQAIDGRLASLDAKIAFRHINSWGESGGVENITARLAEHLNNRHFEDVQSDMLVSIWQAVQGLGRLSQGSQPTQTNQLRSLLEQFFAHRSKIERESGDPNRFRRDLIERVLISIQSRSDTWLVRELIGLDPDMVQGANFGFVIPLRSFRLLPTARIETERAKWYQNADNHLRICRLRGIYKSDLVQQFANLFVRVGLEDYRNEEHRRLFKRCAEDLFPGAT